MHDLLLRGGTVVDPSSGLDGISDIAVQDGVIARIATDIPSCHTEVIPFLHICQTGLATLPDIIAESSINLEDTLRVAEQYKGLICGIKARMVSPALEIMGMEMPRLAKRAARESGINLMVHIGDTEKR